MQSTIFFPEKLNNASTMEEVVGINPLEYRGYSVSKSFLE